MNESPLLHSTYLVAALWAWKSVRQQRHWTKQPTTL